MEKDIHNIIDKVKKENPMINYYKISKPLISYHRHNEDNKTEVLINKILNGENIAIITDAGTPAISDPGEEVVKQAIEKNIEIIPIPGACALINALICSGMNTKEFCFYGFLSLNKKIRKNQFEKLKKEDKTIIIYEAPHKINQTLKDILSEIGDRNIVLARELTKIHEQFIRGKVSEIIENYQELKGEMIIIIEGNSNINDENDVKLILNNLTLDEHYDYYKKQNYDKKEIIKKIAKDRNVNKNEIYMKLIDFE